MPDLGPQPDLRTERLWLTPFAAKDAAAVFDYARNPRVAEHTTWRPQQSVADAVGFIEMVRRYASTHCWAIRLSEGGPARGAIEFGLDDSSSGSVHYVLAEELWNQGFMTEATRGVLEWAFDTLGSLERVATTATPANVGSRRVLEKCGFEFSGLVIQDFKKFGGPIELAAYVLTRGQWRKWHGK
jgi:RimJ/RimL family protein N-acetyltransferase